jgi:hypothetical protein
VDRNSQAAKAGRKQLREQLTALEKGVDEAKEQVVVATPKKPPPPPDDSPYTPIEPETLRGMQTTPPTTTDEDEPVSPLTPKSQAQADQAKAREKMDAGIKKIEEAKKRLPPALQRDSSVDRNMLSRYSQPTPEPPATPETPKPLRYESDAKEWARRERWEQQQQQQAETPKPSPASKELFQRAAAKERKAAAKARRQSAMAQVADAAKLDDAAKEGRASVAQMREAIEAKDALNRRNS